ncbi:TetR family transcriptional regulator [Mycolicibacterium chitae]|uniref:TetR family transcriptional regulator n=1 Tax=Mycolicibacterium chitae TaxID=1792 RepID=A0A448IEC8_MYCCI|nr:TetR/AcrR family transcriptional regulator [Mycolicibacterium chitae]MCV7104323.1 TetR/AcrR family transcriptional regulator [Mycolicibacterium chitae]BBZ02023.1 TetR family transcriptional regulator [Mycolicibacterium chitae]VEG50842.1 TetR family transcriptional regulator [Mycolicibacterium chitae]
MTRRNPSGAAVLQPAITEAIVEAVLDEMAEFGYARLSMEAVAKRAGVSKSALYRRWSSKQQMALAVLADFSVGQAAAPDTGSLRGDVRQTLEAVTRWLSHPRFSRILPDLIAEMARTPELSELVESMIGRPRREHGAAILRRAIDRGELAPDTDIDIALDLIAAPVYWRLTIRDGEAEPGYLDKLTDVLMRALGA